MTARSRYRRPTGYLSEHGLYIALDKPKTLSYRRDCEIASGKAKLTTSYRKGFGLFLADGNGGFWAIIAELPYAIHFDSKGKSGFFKGRKDIILVPAAALNKLRDNADLSGQDQQQFIDAQESIIHGAQEDQVNE